MFRKIISASFLFAATLLFACPSNGQGFLSKLSKAISEKRDTSKNKATGSLLEGGASNLLGNLLGNLKEVKQSDMVGTWTYTEPSVSFESENLLSKAGGAVAAKKLETEMSGMLAKVGIKEGSCSYTFNADSTYTATIAGKSIHGKYTVNQKEKTVTMTYLGGIAKVTPKVLKVGDTMTILYESDKLLKMATAVSALAKSSSAKTLTSALSSYKGLYIGLKLKK